MQRQIARPDDWLRGSKHQRLVTSTLWLSPIVATQNTHTNPRFLDSHKTRFSANELDEQVVEEIPAQTACCWPLPTLASPAGELGGEEGP